MNKEALHVIVTELKSCWFNASMTGRKMEILEVGNFKKWKDYFCNLRLLLFLKEWYLPLQYDFY